MTNTETLRSYVMSLPPGGPIYEAAAAVCILRGRNAFDIEYNHMFGSIELWRSVVLEAAMTDLIRTYLP